MCIDMYTPTTGIRFILRCSLSSMINAFNPLRI